MRTGVLVGQWDNLLACVGVGVEPVRTSRISGIQVSFRRLSGSGWFCLVIVDECHVV